MKRKPGILKSYWPLFMSLAIILIGLGGGRYLQQKEAKEAAARAAQEEQAAREYFDSQRAELGLPSNVAGPGLTSGTPLIVDTLNKALGTIPPPHHHAAVKSHPTAKSSGLTIGSIQSGPGVALNMSGDTLAISAEQRRGLYLNSIQSGQGVTMAVAGDTVWLSSDTTGFVFPARYGYWEQHVDTTRWGPNPSLLCGVKLHRMQTIVVDTSWKWIEWEQRYERW